MLMHLNMVSSWVFHVEDEHQVWCKRACNNTCASRSASKKEKG